MTAKDKDKLELLLRRQKGQSSLLGWLHNLREASNVTATADDFLDIEETANLRAGFYARVRGGDQTRRLSSKHRNVLLAKLTGLGNQNKGRMVLLFHSQDKDLGALRIDCKDVCDHAEAIWRVTEEDLSLATRDLKSGLCLEKNFYDETGSYVAEGIYELTAWGELAPQ